MNKLVGWIGMLGATAIAAGCSVEPGEVPEDNLSEISEELMCSGDAKFKTEATLAAVVAREIGRWEPQLDFYVPWWGGLWLTQAAFDRCWARGANGCPNTLALDEHAVATVTHGPRSPVAAWTKPPSECGVCTIGRRRSAGKRPIGPASGSSRA